MDDLQLPLRFEPMFKPALWGGRRLGSLLGRTLPPGPVGEAWVLSDHPVHSSRVADGPYVGRTLRELLDSASSQLLGQTTGPGERFPLLLKFLDAQEALSVQVHPDDDRAAAQDSLGKTEAWVILDAQPGSQIYAGLRPGIGPDCVRSALSNNSVPECLHAYAPQPGDCVFLPAGTVHALGAGLVLFEVQQTSDITYRLHDWDRRDAQGRPRELHVEEALACTDFRQGPCEPVRPTVEAVGPVRRERLVACDQFSLWRWRASRPFQTGAPRTCRVLVCVEGQGSLHAAGQEESLSPGDVLLLPAALGTSLCVPDGSMTLLECGLPEKAAARREAA